MPDAEIKKVVTDLKNIKKVFKWTHTPPKSKYGSFAQTEMYSRMPKENTDDAKIGDCRNSNLTCMSEKRSLRKQRGITWMKAFPNEQWTISQFLWEEGRLAFNSWAWT